MEFYAKGQLSYLILTCLLDRDFYGLDIITEISARSNGKINLKKPSVYSNLKRMKKQGYVSDYLQSSDFGPNRKYYSLTEKGRGFYRELKAYFDYNKIDVFRDFVDTDIENLNFLEDDEQPAKIEEKTEVSPVIENTESDDNFFDFSSIEETAPLKEEKQVEIQSNPSQVDYNENMLREDKKDYSNKSSFSHYSLQENVEQKEIEEKVTNDKKDDAVFLPNLQPEEYNQRIFDISEDINKAKKKRSFVDEQIAITVTDPLEYSNEKKKANIEEFKSSLLENKNKFNSGMGNIQVRYRQTTDNSPKPEKEPIKDDAKLITDRIDQSEVLTARKIEPPKLKIVSENTKDTRLPAPKRDTNVDPSHREILNRLYSKTKDGSSAEVRSDSIYDYVDLKEFYESQNISFNIYHKNKEKKVHNTNLLYLSVSLTNLVMTALSSVLVFIILMSTNMLNQNTTFLYWLLPLLLVFDIAWNFYVYKTRTSLAPTHIISAWKIWVFALLVSSVIVGLNLICGMAAKPFMLFATTLILPIVLTAIVLPVRYYLTRYVLVKFWK